MGIETAIIGSAILGTYGASRQAKAATTAGQMQSDGTPRCSTCQ